MFFTSESNGGIRSLDRPSGGDPVKGMNIQCNINICKYTRLHISVRKLRL